MNYLVLGSCVTRDAFELEKYPNVNLTSYHARSSLATLASDNIDKTISLQSIKQLDSMKSKFQKRMAQFDLTNKKIQEIESNNFDKIIIDLIDERFHLTLVEDKIVTKSSSFEDSKINSISKIDTLSVEFFKLWCKGFDNLINVYVENGGNTNNIIVNQVYWATHATDGNELNLNNTSLDLIEKHNKKLDKMYDYIKKTQPECNFLEFDKSYFQADHNHQWGLAPFHYKTEYYVELMNRL